MQNTLCIIFEHIVFFFKFKGNCNIPETDCYSNRLLHDDLALHSMREQSSDSLLRSWINLRMLQLKNVVMTPHVAFNSIDAVHRILKTANDNIEAYLQGNPRNSV